MSPEIQQNNTTDPASSMVPIVPPVGAGQLPVNLLSPKKSNIGLKVILGVGIAILTGMIAVIVILLSPSPEIPDSSVASTTDKQFNSGKYTTEPCEYTDLWPKQDDSGARYWCMSERESWVEFKAAYEGVCDVVCPDRMSKDANGSSKAYIRDKLNLDTTSEADYKYMIAMYMILSREYMLDEIAFAHRAMFSNEKELDAINTESAKRLEQTWNLFLAHKDLDYTFDTTFNGEEFKYDGKYTGKNPGIKDYKPIAEPITDENGKTTEQPVPTNTELTSEDVVALEEWSKSYNPTSPGADGTYKDAIKTYTNKFGMELDYNFDHVYDGCPISKGMDETYIEAAYCHGTPTKIFINNRFIQYDRNLNAAAIVDTVKHEMSHHLIGMTCHTPSPQITRRSAPEAVTRSYAVLFLGADRGYLNASTPAEYQMTAETDRIARAIHDEHRCTSY